MKWPEGGRTYTVPVIFAKGHAELEGALRIVNAVLEPVGLRAVEACPERERALGASICQIRVEREDRNASEE